ncbi:MAG: hypothetical protein ACYCZI_11965, partial [Metallibacterium scheffleri]
MLPRAYMSFTPIRTDASRYGPARDCAGLCRELQHVCSIPVQVRTPTGSAHEDPAWSVRFAAPIVGYRNRPFNAVPR